MSFSSWSSGEQQELDVSVEDLGEISFSDDEPQMFALSPTGSLDTGHGASPLSVAQTVTETGTFSECDRFDSHLTNFQQAQTEWEEEREQLKDEVAKAVKKAKDEATLYILRICTLREEIAKLTSAAPRKIYCDATTCDDLYSVYGDQTPLSFSQDCESQPKPNPKLTKSLTPLAASTPVPVIGSRDKLLMEEAQTASRLVNEKFSATNSGAPDAVNVSIQADQLCVQKLQQNCEMFQRTISRLRDDLQKKGADIQEKGELVDQLFDAADRLERQRDQYAEVLTVRDMTIAQLDGEIKKLGTEKRRKATQEEALRELVDVLTEIVNSQWKVDRKFVEATAEFDEKELQEKFSEAVKIRKQERDKQVELEKRNRMTFDLETLVGRKVMVLLGDGRCLTGDMGGFDQVTNIYLKNAIERIFNTESGVEQLPLGVYLVRGDNIAVIGEIDADLDSRIDFERVKAEPLEPIWIPQ